MLLNGTLPVMFWTTMVERSEICVESIRIETSEMSVILPDSST